MKNNLTILFFLIAFSNSVFADITLYCKQETRDIVERGVIKEVEHKHLWKILVKDTNIVILDPPNITKHGYLERKKFLEDFETIIASKAVFLDGGISFAQKIKINRSTGKTVFDTFEKGSPMVFDHLNCSKEKIN